MRNEHLQIIYIEIMWIRKYTGDLNNLEKQLYFVLRKINFAPKN